MTSMLEAALEYAARGWPVFPCRPGGKEPAGRLVPNGVKMAKTDPAVIRRWWAEMPDANIGIATGHPGPDVLDVDVKNADGYQALAELDAAGLVTGYARLVLTPSGGRHYYYTGSEQRNGSIRGRGIDFRSAGGYVLAPPSRIDRKVYELAEWTDGAAAPIDWLAVRVLLDPPPDPAPFQQPGRGQLADADRDGLPGVAWANVTSWPQILQPAGWVVVRNLGSGRLLWRRPGKPAGISATTRDDGGLYVFSTSTVFDTEVPYTKFGAYAVLEHGGDHSAAAGELKRLGYGRQDPLVSSSPTPPPTGQDGQQAPVAGLPDYDLGQLARTRPQPPERIAGGMLYPGQVHCVAGEPGGGKTTVMAHWMLQHIRDGGHVMFIDEESGPDQAALKFLDLGADPAELSPPHFTYVPFPARRWAEVDVALLHALVDERRPGIIGFDSVAAVLAIAGLDENSASDVTRFWQRVLVPLARDHGAAVIGIDHIAKTGEHGGYGRGSGAKKAASDVQYIVQTLKPFNRTQDGLLRITTRPGKDRQGWLKLAYDCRVKVGDTMSLDISEALPEIPDGDVVLKGARLKLWQALTAITTPEKPATISELVDWIVRKHGGPGLKRQTCSTHLNALAADGLADSISLKPGLDKQWFILTPSASDDASPLTRLSASSPLIGDDDDADAMTAPMFRQPGGRS